MKGLKIVKLEDAIQVLRTYSEMDYPIRLLERRIDELRQEIDGVRIISEYVDAKL